MPLGQTPYEHKWFGAVDLKDAFWFLAEESREDPHDRAKTVQGDRSSPRFTVSQFVWANFRTNITEV